MVSHITVHHKIWVYGYPRELHTSISATEAFEDVPVLKHMELARHYGGDNYLSVASNLDMLDELDVFTLPHHGHHTRDEFTDYIKVKTVLATVKEQVPAHRMAQNERLKKKANEWLVWGDGTKVLTFPYKVGTYEVQESYD